MPDQTKVAINVTAVIGSFAKVHQFNAFEEPSQTCLGQKVTEAASSAWYSKMGT